MALSFLDVDSPAGIRSQIAKGFKGKLFVGVLTRKVNGVPNDHGIPSVVTEKYRVEGFVDGYSAFYRNQAGIPENDVKIILIAGNSDIEPVKNDTIKFPRYPAYQVRAIDIDPAYATFECQSFKV